MAKDNSKSKKHKSKKNKSKSKDTKEQGTTTPNESYLEGDESKRIPLIRCGKPVYIIGYNTIKFYAGLAGVLLIVEVLYGLKLLINAIKIRANFGYYINLISSPDGDILPSTQAIPTFLALVLDVFAGFLLYKLFSGNKQPTMNLLLFILIIVGFLLMFVTFVVFIFIIAHIYAEHMSLHDGMVIAMKSYANDNVIKSQIDRLQIEFQCCGSKKYEEWYDIVWYDTTLVTGGNKSEKSSTPFSCCSMASTFPCIHHDIESTGTTYLYTPEYNLSISTDGCYDIIKHEKKVIGWGIIGSLFLFVFLQVLLLITLRFLQTAHYESSKFEGHKRDYIVWLIGCYRGKGINTQAPEPPPLPPELME